MHQRHTTIASGVSELVLTIPLRAVIPTVSSDLRFVRRRLGGREAMGKMVFEALWLCRSRGSVNIVNGAKSNNYIWVRTLVPLSSWLPWPLVVRPPSSSFRAH